MKVPKLALHVVNGRAYCGRPGCAHRIGTVEYPGPHARIFLEHTPREGWVRLSRPDPFGALRRTSGPFLTQPGEQEPPLEFALRRHRASNAQMGGWQNVIGDAEASPGDVIVCPRCRARQLVPAMLLTRPEDETSI